MIFSKKRYDPILRRGLRSEAGMALSPFPKTNSPLLQGTIPLSPMGNSPFRDRAFFGPRCTVPFLPFPSFPTTLSLQKHTRFFTPPRKAPSRQFRLYVYGFSWKDVRSVPLLFFNFLLASTSGGPTSKEGYFTRTVLSPLLSHLASGAVSLPALMTPFFKIPTGRPFAYFPKMEWPPDLG